MTPDQIASRQFLVSLRGYDRDEVDRFLEQVADTVAGLQRRIRELDDELAAEPARLPAVHETPSSPAPVPAEQPQQAFKALGEETTRILVAAEESARAIKQKAEERAQQEVETARREARDEVESARRTASKVVSDAERRRNQIAEDVRGLEALRDRLVDQLREAVRTTTGVMRGLAPASTDAPATDEPAALGGGRDPDLGGGRSAELGPGSGIDPALEGGGRGGPTPGDVRPSSSGADRGGSERRPGPEPATTGGSAAVADTDEDEPDPAGDLWEPGPPDQAVSSAEGPEAAKPTRLHVFDATQDGRPDEPAAPEDQAPEPEPASPPPDEVEQPEEQVPAEDAVAAASGAQVDGEESTAPDETAQITPAGATPDSRQLREQSLAAVRPGLLRKVKRSLQDVQNEVLDGLRRAGDDHALEDLLPDEDGLSVLGAVGEQFLAQAYEAGLTDGAQLAGEELPANAGDPARVPARSATFGAVISHEVTAALRATLRAGIEAGETATSLSERVGEIFRDLKGPVSEVTVDEHLSRTYGYGTLDAWQALGRTAKAWIPGIAPRCPEEMRAQNAEAGPVELGAEFPTGQVVPPAHDGCDCTLAPR